MPGPEPSRGGGEGAASALRLETVKKTSDNKTSLAFWPGGMAGNRCKSTECVTFGVQVIRYTALGFPLRLALSRDVPTTSR